MNQHSPSQQLIETTRPSGFALTLMDEHHEFKIKKTDLTLLSLLCRGAVKWKGGIS